MNRKEFILNPCITAVILALFLLTACSENETEDKQFLNSDNTFSTSNFKVKVDTLDKKILDNRKAVNPNDRTTFLFSNSVSFKKNAARSEDIKTNSFPIPENHPRTEVIEDSLHKIDYNSTTENACFSRILDSVQFKYKIPISEKLVTVAHPKMTQTLPPKYLDGASNNIQIYDVDQGMSVSYVHAITKDKTGNVWFGTSGGGLTKFDGNYYTHYTNQEGLELYTVKALLTDREGNVWIASYENGIYKYDGKSFFQILDEEELLKHKSWKLFEDSDGKIWICSNVGLFKINGSSLTHYSFHSEQKKIKTLDIDEDSNKNIWIGTTNGTYKLGKSKLVKYTTKDGLAGDVVLSLEIDEKNNIWFGTKTGLSCFDGQFFTNYSSRDVLTEDAIKDIKIDNQSNIWIGTNGGGVVMFNGKEFIQLGKEQGITNEFIRAIYPDESGNIWIGTDGGGVLKYSPYSFQNHSTSAGLNSNYIVSILEDKNNHLWFSTKSEGINKYDSNTNTSITSKDGLVGDMLNTSYEDSKGNIWFGTYYGGLSKFDGKTFKNYTYEDKRHENPIWSICEDKLGNIWIGTTNGVHIFNGDHFTHLSGSEMLGAAPIWCIFKDNEHNLWIGTAENGLIKYDGHNFISYSFDTTLDKSTIFSIFQDSQNALWIGSKTSGLFRLDNTQFTQFSTDNGLSNNTVWSIQEDRKNRIWVTTENGLNLLCPSTELNSQKKISYKILQFEKRDGLAGVDFFLNSSLIDSKNTLWMGSGKALTSLNLNKFQLDTVKPKVYLRQIKLNGQHIDYRNSELKNFNYSEIEPFENYPLKLELPNDINHLTFFFSGIAWSTSHQLKYSYKIDQLNSFWSMPSSEAKADYRHLPSGNYTFRVKAKSNNGFWSESFVYQFKIDAPWWKSWWMFIGYFLIFILTFYSLLKWRTNSLIRRQKVLESEVFIATKKITAQKDAVEAANKDINESLRSAKRIQKAIFPSNELVKKYLPDSFVLYKPKDLVAGDFYWLEHKYDKLFFATADCTGHGVPGAMMSVVCNHGLNRSLREHNCTEPGDILNKTREIVISEFDQLEDEVQDGMDIALCSLEGRTLKYSGANIPLWLISDGVIIETTPDKQPIGNYLNQKPYTTYTIDIQTGDTLYLFTDGFADQFGGERGKKFKTRALRNLILAIYKKPMEEQRKILELTFESWKGELEQIDDVCIMGVRF